MPRLLRVINNCLDKFFRGCNQVKNKKLRFWFLLIIKLLVSSQACSRSQSPDWERNNKPNPVWGIRHLMLDLTLDYFNIISIKI